MDSLLTTKLSIPPRRPRASIVDRSRLTDRLHVSDDQRLTLVSAPAGFGKTTLLTEWIPQNPHCVAWFSLDDDDNDPAHFWAYFIAAVQTLHSDLGASALALLEAPQSPPIEAVLTSLLNDVAAFPDRFALVLDDYHMVDTPAIHQALTFLLDHQPPQMQLFITTRSDPPLPLARWRARQQLIEIRAADLRFTSDEAATFLNRVMGLELSADEITALEAHTEGWIAGLQLAALSMQGRDDVGGFIRSFTGSHAYIIDYLAEEVIQRQTAEVQTFLLQTSILDRMCGSLCDAIAARAGSQPLLEQLERANLFITPLDDKREWFRYHHLFADVLQARLRREQPDLGPELHRRASGWYQQQGLMPEAINHSFKAADYEQAARLMKPIGRQIFVSSDVYFNLKTWLAQLPASLVRSRPELCLTYAWLLLAQGEFDRATHYLDCGEQALRSGYVGEATVEERNTLAELATTRAIITVSQSEFDAQQVVASAQAALADLYPHNLAYRSAVAGALGHAYLSLGDVHRAEQSMAEASAIAQAGNIIHMTVAAVTNLTNIQRTRGAFHLAQATAQQCLDWLAEHGAANWPNACSLYANLAAIFREWNDLETASRRAERAVELTQRTASPPAMLSSLVELARVKEATGDWEQLSLLLDQLEHLPRLTHVTWLAMHQPTIRAHFDLAQGRISEATSRLHGVKVALDFDRPFDLLLASQYDWITPAQVLLARARASDDRAVLNRALATLEQPLHKAEALGLLWPQVKVHALWAMIYAALHDPARAQASLMRALTLAEPERYVRLFVNEGEPMRLLMADYQAQVEEHAGRLKSYVDKLLAAFSTTRSIARGPQINNLVEPLNERELEVLRLTAEGLSNREIADRLSVVVGTVKWYLNHIYAKLDVHSRTQAAARARELDLL